MKKKISCLKCNRDDFKSTVGLNRHIAVRHPYIPPPSPKTTFISSKGEIREYNLKDARGQLYIGDVFYRVEKLVVKSITETEGIVSKDLKITAEVTLSHWQINKPE